MSYHTSVLLQSACHLLDIKPNHLYVDATVGGGGHSREIIARGGKVLGLDQDVNAIAESDQIEGLILEKTNFINLSNAIQKHNWHPISGILFDLGVSSHQLDTAERGFSYQKSGPLDMRMGDSDVAASDIVNQWPAVQLANLFRDYGEIPAAKSLAEKILSQRPFITTTDLANITGKWSQQVFQALRIAVNDELQAIEIALPQALDQLENGGRLVVISFHSLEDRIVKKLFKEWSDRNLVKLITHKPQIADQDEILTNPRSKSAKLRCIEKL